MAWLDATDDIFRRAKPATPSPHLVAYVVLVDPVGRAVFLGRHLNAGLWLPTGGHVEPGEHPAEAARREAVEELGIDPDFSVTGADPLMLTVTTTVGRNAGHVDVSLWYTIRGDRTRDYPLDAAEFGAGRWWDIDKYAVPQSDPHFSRFLTKLDAALPPTA
ncbi:NUDIX hydrolase [Nocardia sp. XZ_19_385]|uniref:NUDIX hydrolase n=1 Tax=Nocardia sp. XZ_19_385 TaxID=2769488 RepID=UPI001E429B0E|nr:NUDIX hydrolase [Nocardia sp. XZ_19_385]